MSRVSLSTVTLDLVRENQADLGEEIAALLRERRLLGSLPKPSPTLYLSVTSSKHVDSHTRDAVMPDFVG